MIGKGQSTGCLLLRKQQDGCDEPDENCEAGHGGYC